MVDGGWWMVDGGEWMVDCREWMRKRMVESGETVTATATRPVWATETVTAKSKTTIDLRR